MVIYIAGPMKGYPNSNFEAFDAAKKKLSEYDCNHRGWAMPTNCNHINKVLTPADSARSNPTDTEQDWIRKDIDMVLEADALFMLKGWEKSVGARAEHALAVWAGKEIRYQ